MSERIKKAACVAAFAFGVAGIVEGIDLILNNAGALGWMFLSLVATAAPIIHWPSRDQKHNAP
jgi:hypothetical protein